MGDRFKAESVIGMGQNMHHVQVDVNFLFFSNKQGERIKRYQYTAIDDSTRIRALKIYTQHTQPAQLILLIMWSINFLFGLKRFALTMAMNFKPGSIGTSAIWACSISISNQQRLD